MFRYGLVSFYTMRFPLELNILWVWTMLGYSTWVCKAGTTSGFILFENRLYGFMWLLPHVGHLYLFRGYFRALWSEYLSFWVKSLMVKHFCPSGEGCIASSAQLVWNGLVSSETDNRKPRLSHVISPTPAWDSGVEMFLNIYWPCCLYIYLCMCKIMSCLEEFADEDDNFRGVSNRMKTSELINCFCLEAGNFTMRQEEKCVIIFANWKTAIYIYFYCL